MKSIRKFKINSELMFLFVAKKIINDEEYLFDDFCNPACDATFS